MKPRTPLIALILGVAFASPSFAQASVFGPGRAKDGDSLMVGDREVRLFGIDAPEFDQTCTKDGMGWSCGASAADRLAQLVTGRNVVCSSVGTDQHGRLLGRCMVGATDVNRAMVASGYAVAFRRYSSDYVSAEDSAKANKRGIWAGTFQMPSDSRPRRGRPATDGPLSDSKRRPQFVVQAVLSSMMGVMNASPTRPSSAHFTLGDVLQSEVGWETVDQQLQLAPFSGQPFVAPLLCGSGPP